MKIKSLSALFALLCMAGVHAQELSVDLTFTAVNNAACVRLDSIKVINRSVWPWGGTVIYWPDTTFTVNITPGNSLLYVGYSNGFPVGIKDPGNGREEFRLSQNQPNPVSEQCAIHLYVPGNGSVVMKVADLQGRELLNAQWQPGRGHHAFRFKPGAGGMFFLTALFNGESRSIRILSTAAGHGRNCTLEYDGYRESINAPKTPGIAMAGAGEESGILDQPTGNKTYTFQFASNIPCPGTPTVTYEGQVYNTIQIFSQCWLKENLNAGTMIPGSLDQTNNGIMEKYCYDNNPDSCTKYGGLYQWNEMMQYTTQQGARGLCPPGWHLPSDEDWMVLEGAVDSQYGIGDNEWDINQAFRGFDAGDRLKSASGWSLNGNGSDLYGFSGLPGGNRFENGMFSNSGVHGYWWTSTVFFPQYAGRRELFSGSPEVGRDGHNIEYAESVRCLRDL